MHKLKLSMSELRKFKKNYYSGLMGTDVIINLYTFHDSSTTELTKFAKFIHNTEHGKMLGFIYAHYLTPALKAKYGKPDFIFKGARKYENYLFEHGGITFITSSRTEYVVPEMPGNYEGIVAEYNKEIYQTVMDYFLTQTPHEYINITQFIEDGLILDGKINWNYSEEFKKSFHENKELHKALRQNKIGKKIKI